MAKEDEDLEQGTVGAQDPPPEVAHDPLTIKVGDDDDDGGDDQPGQAPEQRPGRRQQFRAMREEAATAKQALAAVQRELAELRGRMSAPAPVIIREPAAAATDPLEAEYDAIEAQKDAILIKIRAATDETQIETLKRQYNRIDRKRARLDAVQAAREVAGGRGREDGDLKMGRQILESEFPRLYSGADAEALQLEAQAETVRLAKRRNEGLSLALCKEGAAIVYARHGLGARKPAPTDTDRERHMATGTRPAGSPGNTFKLTKQQNVMALGMYEHRSDLTDEQKRQEYYKKILKPAGLAK
jgi:hypothetical protein